MFREKEMTKALAWLLDLFQPEDYSDYDEAETKNYGGICLQEVCMALRDEAQTVFEYRTFGDFEGCLTYCGKELFDQRGCLLHTEVEQYVADISVGAYNTELWLLEDMSFALVRCLHITYADEAEEMIYETEYRAFVRKIEGREDLYFSPDDLLSELEEMCVPQWEQIATIYEL